MLSCLSRTTGLSRSKVDTLVLMSSSLTSLLNSLLLMMLSHSRWCSCPWLWLFPEHPHRSDASIAGDLPPLPVEKVVLYMKLQHRDIRFVSTKLGTGSFYYPGSSTMRSTSAIPWQQGDTRTVN